MKYLVKLLIFITLVPFSKAQERTNSFDSSRFVFARNGESECQIVVYCLGSAPPQEREKMADLARQLQKYLTSLTGSKPPIQGLDPMVSTNKTAYFIVIDTVPVARPRTFCYQITMTKDAAMALPKPNVTFYISGDKWSGCAKQGIEEFVQKQFGIPLSAIDDPKFKWPQKPDLEIDADKFHTMTYPDDQK